MNEREFLVNKDGPADFPLAERGKAQELLGTINAHSLDEAYLKAHKTFGIPVTQLVVIPKEKK